MMMKVIHVATALGLVLGSSALLAMPMDDASITKNAQMKITSTVNVPISGTPHLIVNTKNGKVMVRGVVETSDQKKQVEKAAKEVKGVEGVKDVDVDIIVQGD